MILEICGGEPSELEVAGKEPDGRTVIAFDPARVEKLTGLKLKPADITGTLKKLGFEIEGSGASLTVTAPSWRPDVHGAADLVEEVIRIVGVDQRAGDADEPRARRVEAGHDARGRSAPRAPAACWPGAGWWKR